jgi:hypothetical protein
MRTLTPGSAWKKVGPDLVTMVKNSYAKYKEKPNSSTRTSYLTWRLRVHLRCNAKMREELELVNKEYELGLYDEEAGPLYWEVERG